jgi:hypothetical protein
MATLVVKDPNPPTVLETRVATLGLNQQGEPTVMNPDFKVFPKPGEDWQLKADWKTKVPDVWEQSVAKIKNRLLTKLFDLTDKRIAEIMVLYPKYEPDTWKEKADLAERWLALNDAGKTAALTDVSFVMIFTEAVGTVRPSVEHVAEITSLCTKIKVNRLIFGAYSGMVLKYKTTLQNAIQQSNNAAALLALDISIPVSLSQVATSIRSLL